ncbi:ATP-dependent nuclease [Aliidiomarina indica]|uniref:ATP-dependent nuclease n=1 Tax=Aliidiomarina indica TaxID=2749147 RepID=UPI00188DF775|nr:TOPRIM nucleotidyl transferase/hydrolase domain-containing protein [Aliidiomarina indica]
MANVTKLKLTNFKRFRTLLIDFNPNINTIIGDNEAGKSTILQAIELVASGNRSKLENVGFETLFNKECVDEFLHGTQQFEDLPKIHVEIYLSDETNPDLFGNHNTDKVDASGLHMVCEPNQELAKEINTVLAVGSQNFPFEFYEVKFITFSGEAFSGYRRLFKCLTIDSSQINSEHANREYIKSVYESTVDSPNRALLKNDYRQQKLSFKNNSLQIVNDTLGDYDFSLRTGSKYNLETDITLTQDNIPIDERGKGQQCFIKTEFALSRNSEKRVIDTLLLEEPENHLSHTNMKRLILKISESHQNQIIIATHNSLISSRLDLRNSILINSSSLEPLTLNTLPASTAKFFVKAPDNNILEFALSQKVILVEGDAEYILFDAFYQLATGKRPEADGVHLISVGGTSFKRYLDLARILSIRTAVVRDNDGDFQSKCVDNYSEYTDQAIAIFAEKDVTKSTFEICLYQANSAICDALFSGGNITKTPLQFMLDNKTESALRLLESHAAELIIPSYIAEAVAWINE